MKRSISLLIMFAVIFPALAVPPPNPELSENELCYLINTGGGEVVQWKGNINGVVKCKIRNVVDWAAICELSETGGLYMDADGYRVIDGDRVVCLYQRKNW